MTWKERAEHNYRVAEQYRKYFEAAMMEIKTYLTIEQMIQLLEGIIRDATAARLKVQDAIVMIEEGRPHLALPILKQVLTLIGKP